MAAFESAAGPAPRDASVPDTDATATSVGPDDPGPAGALSLSALSLSSGLFLSSRAGGNPGTRVRRSVSQSSWSGCLSLRPWRATTFRSNRTSVGAGGAGGPSATGNRSGGQSTRILPSAWMYSGTGSAGVFLASEASASLAVGFAATAVVAEFVAAPAFAGVAVLPAGPAPKTPELPTSRRVTREFFCRIAYSTPPNPPGEDDGMPLGSGLRSWISSPSPLVVWSGSTMSTCDSLVICWVASSKSR